MFCTVPLKSDREKFFFNLQFISNYATLEARARILHHRIKKAVIWFHKMLNEPTRWSGSLEQLWAQSQDKRLGDWRGLWRRLLLLWILSAAKLLCLSLSGVWMASCVIAAPGQTCKKTFWQGKWVLWRQHSSQMLFTALLMLDRWSFVISVAAKWLICFRADKTMSACFNTTTLFPSIYF